MPPKQIDLENTFFDNRLLRYQAYDFTCQIFNSGRNYITVGEYSISLFLKDCPFSFNIQVQNLHDIQEEGSE